MSTSLAAGHRSTAELLNRADDALRTRGCLRESRELHAQAYEQAQRSGDADAMASAALGLGGLWVHEHRMSSEAAEVEARQRSALAAVGQTSTLGLRLRVRLAAEADYRTGSSDGVTAALKVARRAGDPVALADALNLAHHCLLGPQHAGARMPLASELLRAGFLTGRRVDVLMGLLWSTVDRVLAGDPIADRGIAELRSALERDDNAAVSYVLQAIDVMSALRAGRLDEVERLAAETMAAGERVGDADAPNWYAGQLTALRWYQGRTAELLCQLAELAGATAMGCVDRASYAGVAVGYAAAGRHTEAACALARVRGVDFTDMVTSSSWLVAMYASVEAAHLLGDGDTAEAAYAALAPFADLPMVLSLGVACFGSTHHALGVAALTMRDPRRAVEHLRSAVRANQALGHLPATTMSRHRLGQALRMRGDHGDDAEATTESARAVVEARALGMLLPRPGGDEQVTTAAPPPGDTFTGVTGAPTESGPATVTVTRHTERRWEVRSGAHTALVPDCLGIRYLAILAERPGREVEAIELARAVAGAGLSGQRTGVDRQPVLDPQALREYRSRFEALETRIADLEADHDVARAEVVRTERDWLVAEIAAATGLGGQVRSFTHDVERARIAVTKALRRGLERIAVADPTLGAALAARVHTGHWCGLDVA